MTRWPGRETRLIDLVGQFYDAALDEKLWPAVAPAIAEAFAASSSVVFSTNNRAPHFLSHTANFELTALREYRDHYHGVDVWAQGGIQRWLAKVILDQDIIGPAAFAETEIYRDWACKAGVFHLVGAVFEVTSGETGYSAFIGRRQRKPSVKMTDGGWPASCRICSGHCRCAAGWQRC